MTWDDYYEKFYDWSESTQLNRISSLTDFNSTEEIIEVTENFDEKGASKLIRKALSQGVYFSANNIVDLCEYVNEETTIDLIKQCKEKFTSKQKEHINDFTFFFEDEDLDEPTTPQQIPRLNLLDAIGLGIIGANITDKILFGDDDKNK